VKKKQKSNVTKTYLKLIPTIILLAVSALVVPAMPDLIVSKAGVTSDRSGLFMEKITVTVTNACRNQAAGASHVLVTFKENERAGAKAIYFVGSAVKALRGGESSTQTFDLSTKKIAFSTYVFIEADPYKKVSEASEDNNWRTLFPDVAGTILSQAQCAS